LGSFFLEERFRRSLGSSLCFRYLKFLLSGSSGSFSTVTLVVAVRENVIASSRLPFNRQHFFCQRYQRRRRRSFVRFESFLKQGGWRMRDDVTSKGCDRDRLTIAGFECRPVGLISTSQLNSRARFLISDR
jgi:hypothetical protein